MKQYYKWINSARGIGIILVVLGHGIADTMLNSSESGAAHIAFDFIYSFHMPLFFFLSGFVSAGVMCLKTMEEKSNYIIGRFRRLMVPYLIVGLLYIPLKNIFYNEINTSMNKVNIVWNFLTGTNPNFQLWTLYALFLCAVIACIFNRGGVNPILLITFAMKIIGIVWICPIPIIHYVINHSFYYILGIALNRKEICITGEKWKIYIAGMLLICLNLLRYYMGFHWYGIVTASVGIVAVCEIAKMIESKKCTAIRTIGTYSMNIYIMANLIQVGVRSIFLYRLQFPTFLCCIISTVCGIAIPVYLSKYILIKLPIVRMLILGEFK